MSIGNSTQKKGNVILHTIINDNFSRIRGRINPGACYKEMEMRGNISKLLLVFYIFFIKYCLIFELNKLKFC